MAGCLYHARYGGGDKQIVIGVLSTMRGGLVKEGHVFSHVCTYIYIYIYTYTYVHMYRGSDMEVCVRGVGYLVADRDMYIYIYIHTVGKKYINICIHIIVCLFESTHLSMYN